HRNIVPIHSVRVDRTCGLVIVCMPYLGEATLHHVLKQVASRPRLPARAQVILDAVRPVEPAPDALAAPEVPDPVLRRGSYADGMAHLGAQLAEALAFVHAQGIYHRDLKPSNVLLRFDGRPMLLDFNLAVDASTAAQQPGGTWAYMAPEQL